MSLPSLRLGRLALGLTLALALGACGDHHAHPAIPLPALDDKVDRDVVAAVRAARAAVEEDPGSGAAWGAYGDRLLVHDFTAEAAACYERAEALDPESIVWPYRRGYSLLGDRPELALAPLERALATLDGYAPAHELYAYALVRSGRADEAIAHYQQASKLDQEAPHAEAGLGQIYLERGELEQARMHFRAALARDGKHAAAHAGMAQVSLALGQDEKAKNHAELSRTLPPDTRREDRWATPDVPPAGARARTQYAKQLEQKGRLAEAEEQYRLALEGNPDSFSARMGLVHLLEKRGEREAALRMLDEARRRNPDLRQVEAEIERLTQGVAPADAE